MRVKKNERELYTSAKSSPNGTAGAIAARIHEDGVAEIVAIGAASVNNAVKAIAVARGFVAPYGVDLICTPVFDVENIEGKGDRVCIRFIVEPR